MVFPAKENNVLELFFNEPTKHWHFNEIVRKAGISEQRANHWLKQFVKKGLIKRVKPKEKMPYFIANYEHPVYENKKRLYGLNKMFETGLLTKLQSLKKAKTIVIFGSFARGDWNTQSDVDVFIYGDDENFGFETYWKSFGRTIQIHAFKSRRDIKKIRSGLINNVINGYFVKGSVHDIVEVKA
ncbi:nucleotidyltransferase domain-containing protein [Candidatus Woesearchaeota archaeon]|nr:nucleotidyltransferase domain-containing protein [Candidatus Woesearchaeota archaeon]